MSSAAAGDPSPPPPAAAAECPGGWLSGLVSGAGRLLAAVLGPDSPDSSSSSSPESSQSPPPPCGSGDHGNAAHFASDKYQSRKEIVLKDCGEGSLAVVSEIDPKDAIMQLLMQETYSRSECDTLIKIIQERVVDSDPGVVEPAVVLPIAWQAGPQQDPVAYSSFSPNTSTPTTSSVPAYSQEFDNSVVEEKRWLDMKRSTPVEGPCTLNADRSQLDLTKAFPIKVEPLDGLVPLEPDMMDVAEKNHDMHIIGDDSGFVSKLVFQEGIEGAPSSSMGLQQENSSRNCTRGANMQRSTPTKRRSPVTNVYRRQNDGNTIRSKNGLLQQGNPKSVGQEADLGHIQAKRPVGRQRKARR